ncbi:hypothetical protein DAPPUDRAFT_99742 [Daphnia pulex]|uniref:IPO4/5-like TPR repeats domain-containing protein n=1 Tax=Daphnia pulex TaxID=6669 RepID=E9G7Z4_DAPPU|nr:hypothetical protein DAPPUDRAFT_99742 [Daphnia pulex]|eukprot:EFX84574.1 hypothetical protein DAPPUDRAFT_99742 [Daphnia pulex]
MSSVSVEEILAKFYEPNNESARTLSYRIKSGLSNVLTQETDVSLRNTTAQVVASVAKHELSNRKWPELLEFIQQLCCQGESDVKELGLYVLSIAEDSAGEEFEIFFKLFVSIFYSALQDSNTTSAFYACVSLKKLISFCIGTDEATMIQPLITLFLQTLFGLMTEADTEEEDDSDDEYDQVESNKPCIVAAKTLNEMAQHLPPEKVITPLLQWADPVFKGSDIRAQQAGYTALAVVVEGCAEHIRTEYMAQFVQVICGGIKHPQAHVRNAALYAIEKFFGHLQPDIEKYANDILPILFEYLSATGNSLASDTLAAIARTIGEQSFRPFADECLNFTVQLVQIKDDPNLRICAYGVITSLARVMKDDTAAALPVIVPLLMKAVESNEGVTVATKDDNESAFPPVDLLNDDEDVSPMENEDDDESDVDGYQQEKKEACLALREWALQARGPFTSYVEQCTGPVYKLVDCGPCNVSLNYNSHEDIYSAALSALTQFTICIGKQFNGEQGVERCRDQTRGSFRHCVHVHEDGLYKMTQCQTVEQSVEGDDEETGTEDLDSEACIALLEYAGDVLLAFGNAMREHCTIAEKSFSTSVLAECMEPLDGVLQQFVPDLFTTFTNLMRDSDSEVKTNSVFGLGELVLHGRELLLPLLLSDALSRETYPLALDNICGAFTRMIIVNITAVPIDQLWDCGKFVFPLLMSYLPLREDSHENSSVLKCFLFLSSNGHPLFASHLPQVMNVILTMAIQQELQLEQKPMINELMAHIASDFSDLYNEWSSALPTEVHQKLKEVSA